MKSSPDFSFFTSAPVVNAKTGKKYTLEKITALTPDEQTLSDIVRICSEPAAYDFLFRDMCAGAPYTTEHARAFLQWARKGWEENAYFVFAIRDEDGRIAGQINIHSANLTAGEIGYWASAAHSGIMAATVEVLTKAAMQAGYAALIAYTRHDNARSQGVLLKNGFNRQAKNSLRKGKPRYLFRKSLKTKSP